MEEKNQITISLSTLFLIIAIIIILIMGYFIYQLSNNKNELNNKISNLETEINKLNTSKNITSNNLNNTATSENVSKKILTNISKIEISVLDETSTEGIQYTEPVTINNQSEINTLLDIINSSILYPDSDFDKDYGAMGLGDDAPLVELYTSNGNVVHLSAFDNFDPQKNLNIFYISKSNDYSDKVLYKTSSNLQKYVEELYNKYK